jgi:hypothetical protein
MLIRPLDLFTIGDGSGDEYDISELVTFLNDEVLLAPSMLFEPSVRFSSVSDDSFDVELADHGHEVAARVFIDDRGAPIDFDTTDRFVFDPGDPKKLIRARWTTPIEDWQKVGDRLLPTRARAVWHLPDGSDFTYVDFCPIAGSLAYNVVPGVTRRRGFWSSDTKVYREVTP